VLSAPAGGMIVSVAWAASDDEMVAKYSRAVEAEGHVKTVTLRAFPEAEYGESSRAQTET